MYKMKIPILPSLLKGIIRFCYTAEIPPELEVGQNVIFGYSGLGVVINKKCTIGNNVHIHHNVTLGEWWVGKKPGVPTIGNNVEIGTGAVLLGGIKIGNNTKIGANAVVLIDVPENATAVGVPARIVYRKGKR
jgi:serine O-acetyltransferase